MVRKAGQGGDHASPQDAARSVPLVRQLPEVIRLVVMLYVRYPPLLRNVRELTHERGVDICHETVRT